MPECPPDSESGALGSVVGLAGIEPATSALSVLRSNRLSYSPGTTKKLHQEIRGGIRLWTFPWKAPTRLLLLARRQRCHRRDTLAGIKVHDSNPGCIPTLRGNLP